MRAVLRRGWRELREWEQRLSAQILMDADVICSTLVGCGTRELSRMSFPLVVIDECTQATEPRSLLALTLARSAVLVGDQAQLSPTVVSRAAAMAGLRTSLFERLAGGSPTAPLGSALRTAPRGGTAPPRPPITERESVVTLPIVPMSMLTVQYRMHPLLRAWPSAQFYDSRLRDGVTEAERLPPTAFPSASPLMVIDHAGSERSTALGSSRINTSEARQVASMVAALLARADSGNSGISDNSGNGGLSAADVGVITPYAAQVQAIQRCLRAIGVHGVEVRTVDGFQGREKEVIVLSCVRANLARSIGFLDDRRRLNVALTRARRGLLVIGCRRTLSVDPTWASFFDFCAQRGLIARGGAADSGAPPNTV